jgi:hypothetical protein
VFAVVRYEVIAGVTELGLGPSDRRLCIVPEAVATDSPASPLKKLLNRAPRDTRTLFQGAGLPREVDDGTIAAVDPVVGVTRPPDHVNVVTSTHTPSIPFR